MKMRVNIFYSKTWKNIGKKRHTSNLIFEMNLEKKVCKAILPVLTASSFNKQGIHRSINYLEIWSITTIWYRISNSPITVMTLYNLYIVYTVQCTAISVMTLYIVYNVHCGHCTQCALYRNDTVYIVIVQRCTLYR